MNKNHGITLIALVLTIIFLLIIAGIAIIEGNKIFHKAKLESITTNMITLKAKSKIIIEEANTKLKDSEDKEREMKTICEENYKMRIIELSEEQKMQLVGDIKSDDEYICYLLTADTLNDMELNEIEHTDKYAFIYKTSDYSKVDVIYLPGISNNNTIYYTLSEIQAQ